MKHLLSLSAAVASFTGFGLIEQARAIVTVIDDLDPGYSTTGSWTSQAIGGRFNGDWQYQDAAAGTETATWTFGGLAPGRYVLAATTFAQANLSSSVTYTVSDGGESHTRDQRNATNQFDIDVAPNAGQTFARISALPNAIVPVNVTDGNLTVSLTDNDATRFLVADAVRLESVRADVQKIHVIGNGDAGYSETSGSWQTWGGDIGDHGADLRFTGTGTTSDLVTMTFGGLDPGVYRISAAWTGGANRTQSATLGYATAGGSGSVVYDQRPGALAHSVFEEVNWQDMFPAVTVTGSSLTLTLANNNNGVDQLLIADGFRLELIPEPGVGVLAASAAGLLGARRRRLVKA